MFEFNLKVLHLSCHTSLSYDLYCHLCHFTDIHKHSPVVSWNSKVVHTSESRWKQQVIVSAYCFMKTVNSDILLYSPTVSLQYSRSMQPQRFLCLSGLVLPWLFLVFAPCVVLFLLINLNLLLDLSSSTFLSFIPHYQVFLQHRQYQVPGQSRLAFKHSYAYLFLHSVKRIRNFHYHIKNRM